MFEIDFGFYANQEGKIVGFSMIAEAQTEAEYFCGTMPRALREGRGGMKIADNKRKITFTNELSGFGGAFEANVTEKQGKAIEELWKDTPKLGLYKDGIFTPWIQDNLNFRKG